MREITTSGIRPPRDDSAETREIPTKIYDFLGMTAITPPTSALKHLFVMTGIALALALVFTFTSISESFAACNGATATTAGTDEDGAYCGSWDCGAAGSNVTCTLSKGTLTISGEGAMKDYTSRRTDESYPLMYKSSTPWAGTMITKAIVEGNVTRLGDQIFVGEIYLTEVSGMDSVTSLGRSVFDRCTSLTSVDIPNVTNMGEYVFNRIPSLQYINMRSDVKINGSVFNGTAIPKPCTTNPETGMKTCGSCGDKYVKSGTGCVAEEDCKDGYAIDRENKMCNKIAGCSSFVDGACTCDKYYYKKEGGCVSFEEGCGEGWLEKNRECIEASDGCGENYRDMGGYCNRIRYTPAEAAQVLRNDNTNEVTITFKK